MVGMNEWRWTLLAGLLVSLAGCADEQDAVQAVQILGWSDTVVDGRAYVHWGCGQDDTTQFHVHGKDAAGRPAKAIVCCGAGFGKGCTARTER